ncbi:SAM-dependent methyltransferase [Aliiglaciecola sp.]|nr:SAM-dependent methyltransferase [Aliiglaciecola sp.]
MPNHEGSIVCVGLGMSLGAHLSPLSRNFIEQADVVYMSVTNHIAEQWLKGINSNCISLQVYYEDGKDRRASYQQMVDVMMSAVRQGKKVVGAFYGHPGVFAWAPHKVIEVANKEGFHGHMEPGISAEDCLYADLALDPGTYGIAHYEASQFMRYQRVVDNAAYLILWQIGFVGDPTCRSFETDKQHKKLLSEILVNDYPDDHQVAIYECATLPNERPNIQWVALSLLAQADIKHHSTLVIPPCRDREIDLETRTKQQLINDIKKN